ncbi:hypothetical protein JTE90_005564 [Oedothorax gibbosus]|uniref:Agrin n=1 Tax=Oedothorax gibbosus TaxID=931172 RepID=A0AAV6VB05_9ARAC|nr:hypothetical protein JTE90_005564 [Oedothorax gibbosus]
MEAKVCGNDGVTYQNECELRVAACTKQQYITVASKGPCDLCVQVHCKYGARCEAGRCVCPLECPDNAEPVCSSDGATYRNECEMRRAACTHSTDLSVLFYGECEDVGGSGAGPSGKSHEAGSGNYACEEEPCRFGGLCDYDSEGNPQCVCPFECPAVKAPVCGSDGQFYDSECVMREKACKTQKKIVIVPKNRCQKRVEVACDGDKPLINPVTGSDYFCGDGPDSKQCPPSSYCHKTSEFAKCCKEVMVIKSCEDAVHGCCPDGKTAAQGPDQAGCPSHCNCNRLGSYSLTCDPSSQQCPCKPGVGGLHCERCEPGFWGLHKISDGSGGCTPCDCDPNGSVRDDCEQMTGRCVCRQGIKGMKCNICPPGTVLGSGGCVDASIAKAITGSCDELECFHGARCKEKHGEVQCVCEFKCSREDRDAKTPEDTTVCGSDGNSYGSECQLRQFSCRYQKRIEVAGLGPCSKLNTSQLTSYSTTTMASVRRSTETTTQAPTTAAEVKIVRDVTEGPTENIQLTPKTALDFSTPPSANTIGLPLFSGKSYLELSKLDAYSRLAIELELKPLASDGIILYNGQTSSGRGDYVSLAIKDGFVEFKYNLGSGVAVLRSSQRLQVGKFHRIAAKRYQKDGMLSVDGQDHSTGHSTGPKNFLDLGQHLYMGYVPGEVEQIFDNVGVSMGFSGCIRHFKIGRQFVDLKYPGSKVLKAVDVSECSDDSCASMPCLNGASCIASENQDYTCKCSASFTGKHCEHQLDSCASDPCSYGATCLLLTENKFSCLCPKGSSGEFCEQVSTEGDESGLILDFKGLSYLQFPTLPNAAHSLSVELWFLSRSANGLLLYNGQKPGGDGDFVALTLLNGFLHFTYNLGSGKASIASIQPVSLGVWHSVKISRLRSRGMLQVDDGPVITGESQGTLTELNLGQPLYIGGVPEFLPLKYSLVVQIGLDGAVQRIAVNDEVWEDFLALSTGQRNIELYSGPPCLPDVCKNGGRCIPVLDDFKCHCTDGFTGKWCNKTEELLEMRDNVFNQPVKFEGSTFLSFTDATRGRKLKHSKENYITITFRTLQEYGLLLWMNKGPSVRGDYLALAVVKGRVELSFNLGKETSFLAMRSTVKVNDNNWHTITIKRNKRLAHLIVDSTHPVTSTSQPGATELNTDGVLWIGGSSTVPSGFPETYYKGFIGCISSVTFDDESLNLSDGYFNYCQPS